MTIRRTRIEPASGDSLAAWREQLMSRRGFLLCLAGGSLAALFPLNAPTSTLWDDVDPDNARWQLLAAVQDHLFPSEPQAPGARELNALGYLQWVVSDESLAPEERAFVLRGTDWVAERALATEDAHFTTLDEEARERVLRAVAENAAGQNWLSTLLLYLFEALLTDPVYGGNPDGIGWKWLGHTPGFPRPTAGKRYGVP